MRQLIVDVIRVREEGWLLPLFRRAFLCPNRGFLRLQEEYLPDLHRTCQVARLLDPTTGAVLPGPPPMYDVRLIHASDSEFVLTGFERISNLGQATDHAQSWLVTPVELR